MFTKYIVKWINELEFVLLYMCIIRCIQELLFVMIEI